MNTYETNPQSIRPTAAAWPIASATDAVALTAFAQLTQPEVAPSGQPPSELALGSAGWAVTSDFILLLAEAPWVTDAAGCALAVRKTTPELRNNPSGSVEVKMLAGVA